MTYFFLKRWDDALVYYQKSLEMATGLQNNLGISIAENNIGNIYQKKEDYQRAIGGLFIAGLLLIVLIYIVTLRTRRNREFAEMNTIKDKFFSIISHDLKNPAIAQRDALQLLFDNSDKWDADSISKFYHKLLKSANTQVDLLYTLLGWAQLQTGRMSFNPIPFDLVSALQSDIGIIKNMAERKGILFEALLPQSAVVTGDCNMIVTVVRNLLTNAIKFTAEGGKVTLGINEDNSGKYTVSVSDTGTGMTPEQIQNLFRLDCQQSREGKAGEHGTGLGLIVCKELLQKHGSQLHIESEVGQGSRFRFGLTV